MVLLVVYISVSALIPGQLALNVFGKYVSWLFAGNALYGWWKQRALSAENSGRFLDQLESRKLFAPKHRGLLLDGARKRLSIDASCRNVAVIATTGAGKTASYILPNLLTQSRGSIVATDPSGTLYARASGDLVRRGYKVYKLDPLDLAHSVGYNPLDMARTVPEMQEVAHILVNTAAGKNSKLDPIWLRGAEEIIGIFIKCLKHPMNAGRYDNLANLQYLLQGFGDGKALVPFVAACAPDDATFHAFKGFIAQSDKTWQGQLSQAKSSLTMLGDPDVARLTAADSFDFAQFRQEKTALFLTFPQNRIGYYAMLMNLFYTQIFHYCLDDRTYRADSLPIYFLLDEFGHLTIPDFSSIITTTRQRKISMSIVLQAASQMVERYGPEAANTILNGGVASRLFFGGMDIDTASELSRMLGEVQKSHFDAHGRIHTSRDALMTPSALRAMQDDQLLYMFANKRPTLLTTTPYFKSRDLLRRSQIPPFQPKPRPVKTVELVPL